MFHRGVQQRAVHACHPRDGGAIEQVAGVFDLRRQTVAGLDHVQGQVVLRRTAGTVDAFDSRTCEPQLGGCGVLQREDHLHQRLPRRIAARPQFGDHLLERYVLMRVRGQCDVFRLCEDRAEARLRFDQHAQRQRVDEQPDERFGFAMRAAGGRCAYHDIRAAAPTRQQHLESREQHHERGCALFAGEPRQAVRDRGREFKPVETAAEARDRGTRTVCRQDKQFGRVGELPFPVMQLIRQHRPFQPAALPDGVVGVLQDRRRQWRRRGARPRVVERAKLAEQNDVRPTVRRDVMRGKNQDVHVLAQAEQLRAEQRAAFEIGAVMRFFVQQSGEAELRLRGVERTRIDDLQHVRGRRINCLPRRVAIDHEARAQHFVALDQIRERRAQGFDIKRAVDPEREWHMVGGTERAELFEKP